MLDFLQRLNSAANVRAQEWRENLPQLIAQPNVQSLDPQGRVQPAQPRQRAVRGRPFYGWLSR